MQWFPQVLVTAVAVQVFCQLFKLVYYSARDRKLTPVVPRNGWGHTERALGLRNRALRRDRASQRVRLGRVRRGVRLRRDCRLRRVPPARARAAPRAGHQRAHSSSGGRKAALGDGGSLDSGDRRRCRARWRRVGVRDAPRALRRSVVLVRDDRINLEQNRDTRLVVAVADDSTRRVGDEHGAGDAPGDG